MRTHARTHAFTRTQTLYLYVEWRRQIIFGTRGKNKSRKQPSKIHQRALRALAQVNSEHTVKLIHRKNVFISRLRKLSLVFILVSIWFLYNEKLVCAYVCVRLCMSVNSFLCAMKRKTGSIVNDAFVFKSASSKCVDFMVLVMCSQILWHASTKINMVGSRSWAQLNWMLRALCAVSTIVRSFSFVHQILLCDGIGWDGRWLLHFSFWKCRRNFIQFNQIWWVFCFRLQLKIYLFRQVKIINHVAILCLGIMSQWFHFTFMNSKNTNFPL